MDVDALSVQFDSGSLAALQVALGFVMFGVSLDLKAQDFVDLFRDPRAPAVGLLCQFVLLPAIACPLALAIAPTPSMALGLMLVAACPGGNVSNFLTQIGNGRLAVSVGMTAISTLAAVITTPFNLTFWGTRHPSTAALVQSVALDPIDLFQSVALLLLVPVALGMGFAWLRPTWAARLSRAMKGLSLVFFGFVVLGAFSANFGLFLQAIGVVFLPVALLNAVAIGLGYGAASLAGLTVPERRAVSFEVGIQNSGLGLVLVFSFFQGLGGMAIVAAWWGIWHILAGLFMVGLYRWQDRSTG